MTKPQGQHHRHFHKQYKILPASACIIEFLSTAESKLAGHKKAQEFLAHDRGLYRNQVQRLTCQIVFLSSLFT